ncbi:hypothetical protein [Agromyces larvae]|uniref:Uncharacterized protein n=1 Tax=Agromyces larvae TaxID=2929802 RepID=A0ABY4C2B3_9MICO|nr:hypothetical protein [Agromyces larvae]UOE44141.1 hypothetical protein MTO99_18615 [Agromyces larvae]
MTRPTTRRIELRMRKPWFALYWGVKPTVVIDGRGQPTQWGVGTWQVPADETVTIGAYLFNRVWRFGAAEFALAAEHPASLEYAAPALPFLPGRIEPARAVDSPSTGSSRRPRPAPRS